ncbi:hypothetical protein SAMN04488058_10165 [Deinococcus reticulitermitis]|uniref:Helix-turn-helix domain-containing protein n=1 Tax=Deinococcus reticulitermitis TaxID=856736 RepID=A0A1H6RTE5_9DEIO|nr:hypothetical protein [Deinococcus reticulitermitis]SEI59023.1 hypothetical protein SAMN04488058_10165 [Deinococcus reticulitermitis]
MVPVRLSERECFTAQTPQQARLLLDFSYFKVLGRVMREPSSAGEVAQSAGLTVKQAHHRLTRLLAVGLVEVCGERARAGRAVKLYRAVADEYRVPFALTPAATLGETLQILQGPFLAEQHAALAHALTRASSGEVKLSLNAQGRFQASLGETSGGGPGQGGTEAVFSIFAQGHCTPEVAAELERRLQALSDWFQAHAQEPGEGRRGYQLGLRLNPSRES